MNILYFGSFCDEELHIQDEKKSQKPYRVAQYSYEKAFCSEICKINKMQLTSIYQMESFPKNGLVFWRKKRKFENTTIKYLKYINIPILKELMYFFSTCLTVIIWYLKNRKEKDKCIYANKHYAPVSLGIVSMGRLLRIKRYVTFTDLSLFTYSKEKIKKMKTYKKLLIKPYVKLVNKLQESYDGYILFSRSMNEIVNPNKKPYIVMEGIYNANGLNLEQTKKVNAIAHAGTLNREYGIEKILEVFEQIEDESLELWLIGKGDMEDEIRERAKNDRRIKYLGYQTRDKVFEYLKQAKLLINLRNPDDIYTKYSFPSKTFEYMVSGTPFFTTKLIGIPKEYEAYLYTISEYSVDKIKNEVENILNKEENELNDFGYKARRFIIDNKNAKEQVKKINQFLKEKI